MDRGRITWKIRGALQLYDSFSARPAKFSQFRILTEEGICVMKKEGGLLIFAESGRGHLAGGGLGKSGEEFTRIRLESPIFLPEELTLSSSLENLPVCLRLRPNKAYPAPSNAAVLHGHCAPGAEVFFVFDVPKNGMGDGSEKKLLSDLCPDVRTLEIYHPGRNSLEGEWIELEYHGCRERLFLGRMEASEQKRPDTGKYRLCGQGAGGTYPRLETVVRLVYFTKADPQGEYVFYFRQVPGGSAGGRIGLSVKGEEQKAEREIRVVQGESIRLDLQQACM